MAERSLEVFDQTLTALSPGVRPFNHPPCCHQDKSRFTLCCFFGFRGLGCDLKPDLGENLWVEFLEFCGDFVWVVATVEQNCNLWNINGFNAKVIQVVAQQFNQATVVRHTGRSAVGKKRKTQRLDSKMPFNPIGAFVMAEPCRTSHWHCRYFSPLVNRCSATLSKFVF